MTDDNRSPEIGPSVEEGGGASRAPVGSVRDLAVHKLALDIVAGTYKPGHLLSLETVSSLLGVTKQMAREVTQTLSDKGLVQVTPRVGAIVQSLDSWAVLDPMVIDWRLEVSPLGHIRSLVELREAIEPVAAHAAATRASPEQRQRLMRLSEKLKELGLAKNFDREAFQHVDARFHEAVLASSQNEMFHGLAYTVEKVMNYRIQKMVAERIREQRARAELATSDEMIKDFPLPGPEPIAVYLHVGMAHAIDQGYPAAARDFCRAILMEMRGKLGDQQLTRDIDAALRDLYLPDEEEREKFQNALDDARKVEDPLADT